jgi:hypothetical protein
LKAGLERALPSALITEESLGRRLRAIHFKLIEMIRFSFNLINYWALIKRNGKPE